MTVSPVHSSFEFIAMRQADIDAVWSIEQRIHSFPWPRGHFVDSLDSGYLACLLQIDGCLAGYAVVMMNTDDAELLDIGIDLPWQGQGWGTCLMNWLLDGVREHAAARMLLEVRASNRSARALYERCGFVPIGLRRGYYPTAIGREDALVLARSLDE